MRTFQRACTAAAALLLVLGVTAFSYHRAPGDRAPSRPAAHLAASTAIPRPGHPIVAAPGQHGMADILRHHSSVIHSLNWSGYAVGRPLASFRNVRAAYFVPYVDCAGTPNSYSSHWVGLDGLGSASVEQVGVAAGCAGTAAQYYAWYEMYPKAVSVEFSVHPGNSILASVYYDAARRKFVLRLRDITTGKHFSKTLKCAASACTRSSAEVISEAPSSAAGQILPLADYRAASFSSVSVTNARGHRGGLHTKWWHTYQIVGTGPVTHEVTAQPTVLYQGQAFSVYWFQQN